MPFKALGGVYGSWFGVILIVLVLIAQFYVAIWPLGAQPETAGEIAESFFGEFLLLCARLICLGPDPATFHPSCLPRRPCHDHLLHHRIRMEANSPSESTRDRLGLRPQELVDRRGDEGLPGREGECTSTCQDLQDAVHELNVFLRIFCTIIVRGGARRAVGCRHPASHVYYTLNGCYPPPFPHDAFCFTTLYIPNLVMEIPHYHALPPFVAIAILPFRWPICGEYRTHFPTVVSTMDRRVSLCPEKSKNHR